MIPVLVPVEHTAGHTGDFDQASERGVDHGIFQEPGEDCTGRMPGRLQERLH